MQKIHVEIINQCNLKCSFCPPVERPAHRMSPALFEMALKQVSPLTSMVCLHLMGEPLSHPELPTLINLCYRHGIKIFMVTNGLLLRGAMHELLLHPAFFQVNISLHSFSDNFPERDPSRYLDQIFTFTEKALRARPDLYINFRLWNLSPDPNPMAGAENPARIDNPTDRPQQQPLSRQSSDPAEASRAKENGTSCPIHIAPHAPTRTPSQPPYPTPHPELNQKILAAVGARFAPDLMNKLAAAKPSRFNRGLRRGVHLQSRLYVHFDGQFTWPHLELPSLGTSGTCYGLQSHCGILSDGTVVPCCLDKEGTINLGNIRDQSLSEILNSPRARKLRSGFARGQLVEPLCQRCNYIQRFI